MVSLTPRSEEDSFVTARRQSSFTLQKMHGKHAKLILFRGFDTRGLYTVSPFVTKLELRLRLASLAYDVRGGSPSKAPMGKIPYVDVGPLMDRGLHESLLGDSTLIIKNLVELGHLPDLSKALSGQQVACDLAIRALLEDKLYFYQSRERWVDNYYVQRDTVLHSLVYPVRVVVGLLIFRNTRNMLHSLGIGRLPAEQFEALKVEIWHSLNNMLEESMRSATAGELFWCLGGSAPTEADAALFGFVVSVLVSPA